MTAIETIYPSDYAEKLRKYKEETEQLRIQRERFMKEHPDRYASYRFLQVAAPPIKLVIRHLI